MYTYTYKYTVHAHGRTSEVLMSLCSAVSTLDAESTDITHMFPASCFKVVFWCVHVVCCPEHVCGTQNCPHHKTLG